MELMNMGIKRDALSSGVNVAFQSLPSNPKKLSLEEYLMQRGYVPLQDDVSLYDEEFNRYKVRRIESSFLPFVDNFRVDFQFSAAVLGWIKNPPADKLDALVPDTWPNALGRTFREYCGQCEAIGDDVYYSMHTFWEGAKNNPYSPKNESAAEKEAELFYSIERFGARPTDPSEVEFWLFYDYFGKSAVVLDYEKPKANE